jgi:hypothetical protein
MSLYSALKVLGYNPYHVLEIFKHGTPHMRMMAEAGDGAQGRGQRFTRADFDKLFAGYDVRLLL